MKPFHLYKRFVTFFRVFLFPHGSKSHERTLVVGTVGNFLDSCRDRWTRASIVTAAPIPMLVVYECAHRNSYRYPSRVLLNWCNGRKVINSLYYLFFPNFFFLLLFTFSSNKNGFFFTIIRFEGEIFFFFFEEL